MTAHAQLKSWHMLQDCITALEMLRNAVDDPDGGKRVPVLWIASVTMLRAVGHVLQKVDAASNPEVKRLLKEAWPHWQSDPVFRELEGYRNKTLKEYDFGWKHRVVPVWQAPHEKPEDDPNVRHYGFLMFHGEPGDAVEMLWRVWHWWMDRVGNLGHLIGPEPLSNRQKTYDCFIGSARNTRQTP